jgi:hypothetical protein
MKRENSNEWLRMITNHQFFVRLGEISREEFVGKVPNGEHFLQKSKFALRLVALSAEDTMNFDSMELYHNIKAQVERERTRMASTFNNVLGTDRPDWFRLSSDVKSPVYPEDMDAAFYVINFLNVMAIDKKWIDAYKFSYNDMLILSKMKMEENNPAYQNVITSDVKAFLSRFDPAAIGGIVRHITKQAVVMKLPVIVKKMIKAAKNLEEVNVKATILDEEYAPDRVTLIQLLPPCECKDCEVRMEFNVVAQQMSYSMMDQFLPFEVEVEDLTLTHPPVDDDRTVEDCDGNKFGPVDAEPAPDIVYAPKMQFKYNFNAIYFEEIHQVGRYFGDRSIRVMSQVCKSWYLSVRRVIPSFRSPPTRRLFSNTAAPLVLYLRQMGYNFHTDMVSYIIHQVIAGIGHTGTLVDMIEWYWDKRYSATGIILILSIIVMKNEKPTTWYLESMENLMRLYRRIRRPYILSSIYRINRMRRRKVPNSYTLLWDKCDYDEFFDEMWRNKMYFEDEELDFVYLGQNRKHGFNRPIRYANVQRHIGN